jgi:CheY-like chemotaxis protein
MTDRFRIIFVDDDADDQYLVKRALAKISYQIELVCLNSAKELFSFLDKPNEPLKQLILLDLNLPMINGNEALKKLKQSSQFCSTPCIIYSTSQSSRDIADAYQVGANSFIIKPDTFTETVKILQQLCDYWFGIVTLKGND